MKKLLALLLCLAPPCWATAGEPAKSCEPRNGIRFICGPQNAEDLVQVPGTPWIIASGHADDANFYLVDARSGAWRILPYAARPDPVFASCNAPPAPATFRSHGLDVLARGNGAARLHVVGHGAREAIEFFDIEMRSGAPSLVWRGCVPMPEGYVGNSVASAADGSLVATILLLPGKAFSDSFTGRPTGIVLAWSPGEPGFTPLAGTELPANNGIEVSADGREIYVASSGLHTIVAYSRTNPARKLRTSRELPFTPDNVHLGEDGMLYTAGMENDVPACGGTPGPQHDLPMLTACPRGTIAVALDPRTLSDRVVLKTPVLEGFSNATMLLPVGNSFRRPSPCRRAAGAPSAPPR
jgi:hypothetical protein